MKLTVSFDKNGCLDVPEVTSGLTTPALNSDILAAFGQLLRTAQNSLDRMPTYAVGDVLFGQSLAEGTSEAEKAVFEQLRELNAEIVLRVLVMRRMAVAAQTGQ